MSDFDNIFKRKLSEHPSNVPDDMWSRVESKLPAKATRKVPPYFTWLVGGLILIGALAVVKLTTSNTLLKTSQQDMEFTDYAEAEVSETSTSSKADLINTLESKFTNQPSGENFNEKETINIPSNNEEQNEKVISEEAISTATKFTINKTTTGRSIHSSSQGWSIHEKSPVKKSQTIIRTPLDKEALPTQRNVFDFKALSMEQMFLANQMRNVEISRCYMGFQQDCPSFVKDETGLYLDFYISHDYGIRSLKAKSPEFETYRAQRDSTESSLYSFSAGFRLSFLLPNGFGIKTGLNYSQINEKFTQVDQEAIRFQTVITIDTVFVNGQPVEQVDTTHVQVFGLSEIIVYNRYKMFDIPILLSYEFGEERSRFYYSVNGGILINVLFSQKGRFISPQDGEPVWFTSDDTNNYKAFDNTVGLTLVGSFGAYYRWTNNMDLMIEPNFKYNLKSMTLDAYPLEQKYLTVGVMTGIRYRF